MRELLIGKNDAGQRIDKFLTKALPALPAVLIYKFIRIKKIKCNGARTVQGYILHEGDVLSLYIKDEFFEPKARDDAFTVLTPRLDIVYEDENIIVCDKRPGIIVHSDESESTNTLISHIKAYLYRKGEYDPRSEKSFAPALCNRIDRNTGGMVIAAKTAAALREMNEAIKNNQITKKYLCAVHGILDKKSDTLTGYLVKDSATNRVKVYDERPRSPSAKSIVTKYRVLSEKGDLSLVDVTLVTGRTHQIRAHFAHIGHPLLGDGKYGVNAEDRKRGYKFQALYSYDLTFHISEGTLSYLDGKNLKVDKSKIWFLSEFS